MDVLGFYNGVETASTQRGRRPTQSVCLVVIAKKESTNRRSTNSCPRPREKNLTYSHHPLTRRPTQPILSLSLLLPPATQPSAGTPRDQIGSRRGSGGSLQARRRRSKLWWHGGVAGGRRASGGGGGRSGASRSAAAAQAGARLGDGGTSRQRGTASISIRVRWQFKYGQLEETSTNGVLFCYISLAFVSGKDSLPVDLPKPVENEKHSEVAHSNVNPFSVHPLPLTRISDVLPESSNGSDSLKEEKNQYYPGKEIKRRKRHRRKQYVDQEPCIMRGVYFKNMKWQAAIKVDKKQIHLGTVGTQDEAARLYDRAAFMCGREPNFELSEEEKKELDTYTWEDFLAITRNTITNKKQRKVGSLRRNKADLFIGDTEMVNGGESSHSDDGDVETSAS